MFFCFMILRRVSFSPLRQGFYTLKAFHIEVNNARDVAKHNMGAASIRLRWWVDFIEDLFKLAQEAREAKEQAWGQDWEQAVDTSSLSHPLGRDMLLLLLAEPQLSKSWFLRIVEGQSLHAEADYQTVDDMEWYGEKFWASLHYLFFELFSGTPFQIPPPSSSSSSSSSETGKTELTEDEALLQGLEALSHSGIAIGLLGCLQNSLFTGASGIVYHPKALLKEASIQEGVFADLSALTMEERERLANVNYSVSATAYVHHDTARNKFKAYKGHRKASTAISDALFFSMLSTHFPLNLQFQLFREAQFDLLTWLYKVKEQEARHKLKLQMKVLGSKWTKSL